MGASRVGPTAIVNVAPLTARLRPRPLPWHRSFFPVEWRGTYSRDKFNALEAYAVTQSATRQWLVVLLTPVPALAVALGLEAALPLNEPALGWRHNLTFLARNWVRAWLTSAIVDTQIALYIPNLRLPRHHHLIMNAIQGLCSSAAIAALSEATGVFPVPFGQIATMPVYVACAWSLRFLCDPKSRQKEMQQSLINVMRLINFTILLNFVYAAFATIVALVPERYRSLLAVGQLSLKAFATRGEWHRANALDRSDFVTVDVSYGTQLFHALFVSVTLQKATSLPTLVTVVTLTALYDAIMIRALLQRAPLVSKLVPSTTNALSSFDLRQTAFHRFAQCTEATLLRLYVDVTAPLVFFAFVVALHSLPNGAYLPLLWTNDVFDLAVRLGVQLAFKLVTLAFLLWRLPSSSISGLVQLAFALERMGVIVQTKGLYIVLCVLDFSLLHNGNDLTFQFAWLKHRPS